MTKGKVRVIHRMADGSVCEDITGKVIPVNAHTELAYKTMAKILLRIRTEKEAEKSVS